MKIKAEEFKTQMEQIEKECKNDPEYVHVKMDELMCKVLVSLGYGEGVQIFENTCKWYA